MMINTNHIVPMTDANQNFSKVVKLVDRSGMAVIVKNNKPKYVIVVGAFMLFVGGPRKRYNDID